MKTIPIKLHNIDKINQFVEEANKVDGDVILKSGTNEVNAKSIAGVLSLALNLGYTVMFPDDAVEFEKYIKSL